VTLVSRDFLFFKNYAIFKKTINNNMSETFNQQNDRENVEKTEVNYDEIDRVFGNLPEVRAGDNVWQNKFHEFDVLRHTRVFVDRVKEITNDPEIIVAGWLHDIGKPVVATPKLDKNGLQMERESGKPYHEFTNHEVVGEEMVKVMPTELFEQFNLNQEKVASLVGCHYLPMKGIKAMRETKNFSDFVLAFNQLKELLESLSVTKEEVLSMFIADCFSKGVTCSDQPELLPIREVLLQETQSEEDLRQLYQIQKDMYGGKE
jgi:hypothetical protein